MGFCQIEFRSCLNNSCCFILIFTYGVTDRKKDLVKLQAGEYVSLGKVESELKTCPIVENICVYGDARKDYTVALVVPNPTHLTEIASRLSIPEDLSFEELCDNPEIEKAVLHEINEHGKKCKSVIK